jgi:hypothetical protein
MDLEVWSNPLGILKLRQSKQKLGFVFENFSQNERNASLIGMVKESWEGTP